MGAAAPCSAPSRGCRAVSLELSRFLPDAYFLNCGRFRRFRFVTTADAEWFDYQSDIVDLAAFSAVHEFQHDRIRGARLVPDVSRRRGFSQNKPCRLSRYSRLENFRTVMSGRLFWAHLFFGITSLPPIKIWRII